MQRSVPVHPQDTLDALQERIKAEEHVAYPEALRLLATGQVRRHEDGHVMFELI